MLMSGNCVVIFAVHQYGGKMTKHSHRWDSADILTWIGILTIVLWALGKSLGFISSPVWVEMIPVYGAAAALAGISIGIGRTLQKLDRVISDVEQINRTVVDHDKRLHVVEQQG